MTTDLSAAERATRARALERVLRVRWLWLVRDVAVSGLAAGVVVLWLPSVFAAYPVDVHPLGLGLALGAGAVVVVCTAWLWTLRPRSPELAGPFSQKVIRNVAVPAVLGAAPAALWTLWVSTAPWIAVWFGAGLVVLAVAARLRLHLDAVALFRHDAELRLGLRRGVGATLSAQQVMELGWDDDDRPCGRP